jgi:hypothetical protein
MNILNIKEEIVSAKQRIDFKAGERVVGITIKNQGSSTVLSSFGTNGKFNKILPLSSEGYGGIPGYYMDGYVELDFDNTGDNEAIIKYFYDKGEYCE